MSEWHEEPQTARAVAAKLAAESTDPTTIGKAKVWAMLAIADAIRSHRGDFDPALLPRYNPDGSAVGEARNP